MENKDEYLVYTRSDNTRFYYKNKKLHREAGPAIVIFADYAKYLKIGDEDLYKRSQEPVESYSYNYNDFEVRHLPNGDFVVFQSPTMHYFTSYYYLNGVEYSEQEFNAIILKNKLNVELSNSQLEEKRVKV